MAATDTVSVVTSQVGDTLPKTLSKAELCRVFRISWRTFYRREKAGEFLPFELARPVGRARYSGERIARFLAGRRG